MIHQVHPPSQTGHSTSRGPAGQEAPSNEQRKKMSTIRRCTARALQTSEGSRSPRREAIANLTRVDLNGPPSALE